MKDDKVMRIALIILSALSLISTIVLIFINFPFSTILQIIIVAFIIFVILKIKTSNYRLLLAALAIFVSFHFLVFPYSYLFIYNNDQESIIFDEKVNQNVSKSALSEIKEYYEPTSLSNKINIINKLLNSDSNALNTKMKILNEYNILKIDEFLLYKSWSRKLEHGSHFTTVSLILCDLDGIFIENIIGESGSEFQYPDMTLKTYLKEKISILKQEFNEYNEQLMKIDNKLFWDYSKIIPYSINIFSENMVPKSSVANIIFTIHQIFFVSILGLILPGLYKLLDDKFSKINNQTE